MIVWPIVFFLLKTSIFSEIKSPNAPTLMIPFVCEDRFLEKIPLTELRIWSMCLPKCALLGSELRSLGCNIPPVQGWFVVHVQKWVLGDVHIRFYFNSNIQPLHINIDKCPLCRFHISMDLSVDRHLVFHDLKVFLVSYSISNVSMAIRTISSLYSGSALKDDLYPTVSAISENNSDSILNN